ncbi:BTAD domain-containing putative transcriptional regulator [Thermus sp. CCB_US3_UF1]|uniref:BTAD domain-containing putative transcriptional regulator n=1 Tax=Thermus sp. CCB_US3_UF1 TaxID=1111069 RepID=UPI0018C8CB4A|nr:BTAD domain-containing putative transcriptional regulator [Thermus sp. CCB_US3_UF1]
MALPTAKLWGLIGYLAVEGPQDRGHLAGLLWELPEERARANLRRELFRLRQITPCVEEKGGRLALKGVETDLEALLKAVALREWGQVTSLIRGEFLEGIHVKGAPSFEEWLESTREHLRELHVQALLHRTKELRESGALKEALETLERLLALDPLREEAQGLRVYLLAALGEPQEALEAYQAYQNLLWKELGTEPGPELNALAESLRKGQLPPLSFSAPSSLRRPPLVGREKAWKALEQGKGFLLLVGEGGLGKTRLLQEYAQTQRDYRMVAHREGLREVGFGGLTDCLRDALQKGNLGVMESPWREELARLLPELGSPPPPPAGGEASLTLSRLHEALVRALVQGLPPGGVIALDDLQHADGATLAFLPYLVRRAAAFGVRVLGATRPEALKPPHPLALALRELGREDLLQLVRLEPIGEEDVLRLVRLLSGMTSGGVLFSRRLHQATGGNPLFLLRTLEHLFAQGLLWADKEGWHTPFDEATEDYRELPLPRSIGEEVVRGLEALGGKEAAQLLAVAEKPLDPFALRRLLGGETLAWLETLETLEAAGYLRGEAQGFTLAHELIRQAVLADIPETRLRVLHGLLAEDLLAQGETPYRHLAEAGRLQEAWKAALEAGLRALERQALAVAAEVLLWAKRVQEQVGASPLEKAQLFLALEEALNLSARLQDQAEVLQALERLTPSLPPSLRQEVAFRRVRALAMAGRWAEALAMAERALAEGDHPHLRLFRADALSNLGLRGAWEEALAIWQGARVRADSNLMAASAYLLAKLAVITERDDLEAWLDHLASLGRPGLAEVRLRQFVCARALAQGAWEQAAKEAAQARAQAEALGYREILGVFRNFQGLALARLGRYGEALEAYGEAHALFKELGRVHFQAGVEVNLAGLYLRFGAFAEAGAWAERALRTFRERDEPRGTAEALRALGTAELWLGHLVEAEACYRESLALAEGAGLRQSALEAKADLAVALFLMDRLEAAEDLLRQALASPRPDWPVDAAWLALLLLRKGRTEEASTWAEKAREALPTYTGFLPDLLLLASIALRRAMNLDSQPLVQELLNLRERMHASVPEDHQAPLRALWNALDSLLLDGERENQPL